MENLQYLDYLSKDKLTSINRRSTFKKLSSSASKRNKDVRYFCCFIACCVVFLQCLLAINSDALQIKYTKLPWSKLSKETVQMKEVHINHSGETVQFYVPKDASPADAVLIFLKHMEGCAYQETSAKNKVSVHYVYTAVEKNFPSDGTITLKSTMTDKGENGSKKAGTCSDKIVKLIKAKNALEAERKKVANDKKPAKNESEAESTNNLKEEYKEYKKSAMFPFYLAANYMERIRNFKSNEQSLHSADYEISFIIPKKPIDFKSTVTFVIPADEQEKERISFNDILAVMFSKLANKCKYHVRADTTDIGSHLQSAMAFHFATKGLSEDCKKKLIDYCSKLKENYVLSIADESASGYAVTMTSKK